MWPQTQLCLQCQCCQMLLLCGREARRCHVWMKNTRKILYKNVNILYKKLKLWTHKKIN